MTEKDRPSWLHEGGTVYARRNNGWTSTIDLSPRTVVRFTATQVLVAPESGPEERYSLDRLIKVGSQSRRDSMELLGPDDNSVINEMRRTAVAAATSDMLRVIRELEVGAVIASDELLTALDNVTRIRAAVEKAYQGILEAGDRYGAAN